MIFENNLGKSAPSISVLLLWAEWEGRIIYKLKPKGFSCQGYEAKSLSDCVQISWCLKVPWPQAQQVAPCLLSCLAMTTTPEQKGRGHRELGFMHPTLPPILFLTSPLPAVLAAGSPGGVWGCLNSVYPSLSWPWICSDLPRHCESDPGTLIEKQVHVRAWPNTRPGWEKSQTIPVCSLCKLELNIHFGLLCLQHVKQHSGWWRTGRTLPTILAKMLSFIKIQMTDKIPTPMKCMFEFFLLQRQLREERFQKMNILLFSM